MTEALKGGSNFWVCGQNLWCDHSNETSSAVLSHGTIYIVCFSNLLVYGWNPMVWAFKWNICSSTFTRCYLFSSSSNFWVCGPNPIVLPFKWNLFRSTFTCYYLYSMFFQLSTKSVVKSNSNETPLVVLSRATQYLFSSILQNEVWSLCHNNFPLYSGICRTSWWRSSVESNWVKVWGQTSVSEKLLWCFCCEVKQLSITDHIL